MFFNNKQNTGTSEDQVLPPAVQATETQSNNFTLIINLLLLTLEFQSSSVYVHCIFFLIVNVIILVDFE